MQTTIVFQQNGNNSYQPLDGGSTYIKSEEREREREREIRRERERERKRERERERNLFIKPSCNLPDQCTCVYIHAIYTVNTSLISYTVKNFNPIIETGKWKMANFLLEVL